VFDYLESRAQALATTGGSPAPGQPDERKNDDAIPVLVQPGKPERPPTPKEMDAMGKLIEEAMKAG
jgi:hypothetical protein